MHTRESGDSVTFVAVDTETANQSRGSICSLALVRFDQGRAVDSFYTLVKPPAEVSQFNPFHVGIHGIHEADVKDAPPFPDAWRGAEDFIGDDLVVAHNAAFDMSVIRSAHRFSGLEHPRIDYACTLVTARRMLDLLSYGLPWVADALGVTLVNHHHALADATAAGEVMAALVRRAGAQNIEQLLAALSLPVGTLLPGVSQGERYSSTSSRDRHGCLVPSGQADPEHPLYGKRIVFTGTLESMVRNLAEEISANLGAQPEPRVTKKTNVLVVAPNYYCGKVLTADEMTNKMKKADALRQAGQDIEVMSEAEFLAAI
jgi:DNA polymerase-3 subunit epsilon